MRKTMFLGVVLGVLTLLSFVQTADAQRGGRGGFSAGISTPGFSAYYGRGGYPYGGYYGYGRGWDGYGGRGYGYAPSYYYSQPYYGGYNSDYYAQAPSTQASQSYYSGPGSNEARMHVIVPSSDARVWVEDRLTQQTGTERIFASPPLQPDKTYTYTIRANWMQNGREVQREKQVRVQAGQETTVRFDDQSQQQPPQEQQLPLPQNPNP